jgi:DNA replication protein DnaC
MESIDNIIDRLNIQSNCEKKICSFCQKSFESYDSSKYCSNECVNNDLRVNIKWKRENNQEKYLTHLGIPNRYISCNFNNFIGDHSKCKEWVDTNNSDFLLIQSDTNGNGKTHLAIATAYHWACQNPMIADKTSSWVFYPVIELLSEIRYSFSSEDGEKEYLKMLFSYDLIILDDIGAEKSTEYAISSLYLIINKLYNDCKRVIFTTNKKGSQIVADYGYRIMSRIASGIIINLTGKDLRLKK